MPSSPTPRSRRWTELGFEVGGMRISSDGGCEYNTSVHLPRYHQIGYRLASCWAIFAPRLMFLIGHCAREHHGTTTKSKRHAVASASTWVTATHVPNDLLEEYAQSSRMWWRGKRASRRVDESYSDGFATGGSWDVQMQLKQDNWARHLVHGIHMNSWNAFCKSFWIGW